MFKNKIALFVLVLIVINVSTVFATSEFSDVPSEFWGNNIIKTVTSDLVMQGFDDGKFYPNNNTTKLETILTIYKIMKNNDVLSIENVTVLVNEYKPIIEGIGIPPMLAPYSGGEVYPAIAFALKNEIITESELKYFIEDGVLTPISKIEVSIFYAKALNLVKEENLFDDIISLDYKDQFEITNSAVAYVDLLINNNIVNAKGDVEGKFNPNQIITRAVLAVFANGLNSAIDDGEKIITDNNDLKTINGEGEISYIHESMNIIEIKNSDGDLIVYDISDVKVFFNGEQVNISNLEPLQNVTFSYQGDKIIEIIVSQVYDKVEGTISKVSKEFVAENETYRVIAIVDVDNNNKYLKIYNSTSITVDEESGTSDSLKEGLKVIVEFSDLDAKTVKCYSENNTLTGVLTRPIGGDNIVKVELNNGNLFTGVAQNIDDSVSRGEIVKLYLNYGIITKVESTGENSIINGTISEIVISNNASIVIKKENGNLERFSIIENTEIKDIETDEILSIYDLRLDKTCELNVNSMGISKLTLVKPVEEIKLNGEVVNIYNSLNLIEVINENGENIKVGFSNISDFKSSDFEKGDKVYISGIQISDELFQANNIIIVD
jgi:hypothetical protein